MDHNNLINSLDTSLYRATESKLVVNLFEDVNHDGVRDSNIDINITNKYILFVDKTTGDITQQKTNETGKTVFNATVGHDYEIYYVGSEVETNITYDEISQLYIDPPIEGYLPVTPLAINLTATDKSKYMDIGFAKHNPFECTAHGYIVSGELNQISEEYNSRLYDIDLVTGEYTEVGDLEYEFNAIAYNTIENSIYTFKAGTNELYRIDKDGVLTKINIENIPDAIGDLAYNSGTCDYNGNYYCKQGTEVDERVIFNLDPNSVGYGTFSSYEVLGTGEINDFVWNQMDNSIYYFQRYAKKMMVIDSLNNVSAIPTDISSIKNPSDPDEFAMLSIFKDYKGYIYVMSVTGKVYRVSIIRDANNKPIYAKMEFFSDTHLDSMKADGTNCILGKIKLDFGNAPEDGSLFDCANYKSNLINNGPRHFIIENLSLGNLVIDTDDSMDDDGMSTLDNDSLLTLPLLPYDMTKDTYSIDLQVKNNTGINAKLYAWLDFNKDGKFNVNESVLVDVPSIESGLQTVTVQFTKPSNLVLTKGNTFIRLRLTTDELLPDSIAPTDEDSRSLGPAKDGEVEDYILEMGKAPIMSIVKSAPESAKIGEEFVYSIFIENTGSIQAQNVVFKDLDLQNMIEQGAIELVSTGSYLLDDGTEIAFETGDFIEGYKVGNIKPEGTVTIKFTVKILSCI